MGKKLFFVIILNIFFIENETDILDKTVENTNKCMSKIGEKYISYSDLLLFFLEDNEADFMLHFLNFKLVLNQTSKLTDYIKPTVYILALKQTNLSAIFKFLSSNNLWNPTAKFIVLSKSETRTKIFEDAIKYFVTNIVVIETNLHKIDIYSWAPRKLCENNFTEIKQSCINGNFLNEGELFQEQLKIWENCTVKVLAMIIPPYTLYTKVNTIDGIEVRCLKTIQEKMGFKTMFLNHSYKTWGLRQSNGSYSDMFQELQKYQADVVLGMWPSNFTHRLDFDVTITYLQDSLVWLVPKAQILPHWQRLAVIFPSTVWLTLFFTIVILPPFWTLGGKLLSSTELPSFASWLDSILKILSIILNVTLPKFPRTITSRILFIIWVYSSLILVTLYQSKLLAILVQPQYEKQITTEEELLHSSYKLGANVNIKSLYAGKIDYKEKAIYEKIIVCDLTLNCPNQTAFKRDFATAKTRKAAQFLILQYFTKSDGTPMIYDFKSTMHAHYINVVFAKGHPVFEEYDRNLFKIFESGLLIKWNSDIMDEKAREFIHKSGEDTSMSLSIKNMEACFIILITGYILAALVFITEFLYFKLHKNIV